MRLRLREKREDAVRSEREITREQKKKKEQQQRQEPTQALGEVFIVQADGELLRSPRQMEPEELELVSTAAALIALGMSQKKWPAWVDLNDRGYRLMAVAFDEQIIFMKSAKASEEERVSRVDFIESTRRLVAGR